MADLYREEAQKCPRGYIKGLFIILGMITGFFGYLVYANMSGPNPYLPNYIASQGPSDIITTSNTILTEHINEEADYEKPVCKRLEESGERYDQAEIVYNGEI